MAQFSTVDASDPPEPLDICRTSCDNQVVPTSPAAEALRQQLATVKAERRRNYRTLARKLAAAIEAIEAKENT